MTTLTGNGITLYRLLAKRELGIKGNRQAVIDALTIRIEEVGMNLRPGEVRR